MKTRYQREKELIESGLVDGVKEQFANKTHSISDEYFILIADYLDSILQVDNLDLDSIELGRELPSILSAVVERDLGGIHGRTDEEAISMNSRLNYENKKLFFFHELTHAIQTRKVNGREECGFYNGNTGMFFTEGATQFTAEILYHISNGTNMNVRQQPYFIMGQTNHIPTSPLSEYQFNGSVLVLFSMVTKIPLNEILALGFKENGREVLKQKFEALEGNQGMFEKFMLDLEKIYAIEKLGWMGYKNQMSNPNPVPIELTDKTVFKGNFAVQNELMIQTQRDLVSAFFLNNDENYIINHCQDIVPYLTTNELKTNFLNAVEQIRQITPDVTQTGEIRR